MQVQKITPILMVEKIEPVLPLWEQQLGFTRLVAAPDDGPLAFVLLARGELHVMLQTTSSLALPPHVAAPSAVLYVDVDSLEAAQRALSGTELLVAPHATFYGTRELSVRDAQGQVLAFAEQIR